MESPKILMFPWLAHGHIFPFLELAKTLTKAKAFQIYICSTPINFSSINNFIHKNSFNSSIQLVQLHIESSPVLPPHYHTTKNLPSSLIFNLIHALQTAHSSFSDVVAAVKPDLVIYDVFQPWASKIAASQGIPAVYFSIYGAMFMAFAHHRYTFGKSECFPFPGVHVEEHELKSLEFLFDYLYANVYDADQEFLWGTYKQSRDVVLVKTSRWCEGKYLDYLSTLCNKKLVPVGPLISDANKTDEESSEILKWLSKKSRDSTVFISFGSEYFLSKTDIQEIADGLELCNDVNFVWIIRFPAGTSITLKEVLPQGFLNRVGDRGLVVTGWVPQADILDHPSTGAFMSHCGWSSIMESMYYGVPVIAMPMKVDQPVNAWMLVDAGSCVKVQRNGGEGFKGEEIARAIKKVFCEESGEEMRRRARELSETLKMEKEQVSDDVAEELWQLCSKKINLQQG